ncbi:hypothetical protein BS47DRAFT_1366040 [Hydnum rufescens UP504]|uniref:Uncharacterized protein n=1 Tax=Hydnum rufescens UP504 TaxID=1448309 RepID=A0A9P6AM62_9AGAM|nr:hypothetical protein BS47DRAFT_1366040 [Hydnum rufescens UP504]
MATTQVPDKPHTCQSRSLPYVKTHTWMSHPSPSACPLYMTIDEINEITYHTPTAAGCRKAPKEQQEQLFCAKTPCTKKGCAQPPTTRNLIQELSARTLTMSPLDAQNPTSKSKNPQPWAKRSTTHPLKQILVQ